MSEMLYVIFYLYTWDNVNRGCATEQVERYFITDIPSNRLKIGSFTCGDLHLHESGIIFDFFHFVRERADFNKDTFLLSTNIIEKIMLKVSGNKKITPELQEKVLHMLSASWTFSRQNREVFMCFYVNPFIW